MLILHLPLSFKVGDIAEVKVNRKPIQVNWLRADTMVVGADDYRHVDGIFDAEDDFGPLTFVLSGNGITDDIAALS